MMAHDPHRPCKRCGGPLPLLMRSPCPDCRLKEGQAKREKEMRAQGVGGTSCSEEYELLPLTALPRGYRGPCGGGRRVIRKWFGA